MSHLLSKSTYIAGKQCEKRLWFRKHRRDLIPPVPPAQQFVFDQGNEVGALAKQYFPGGVDVTPDSFFNWDPAIQRTQELMASNCEVIYEAAFRFDRVLVAVDILVRDPSGRQAWKAIEVKSATSVSEVYLDDAALQYHVMTHCGVNLSDISIMFINNQYKREGDIDAKQLFTLQSVMEEVLERQDALPDEIAGLKSAVLSKQQPMREIGPHCSSPYGCEFQHHCWSKVPDYSVFNIARLSSEKKWELYHQGIVEVADVPDHFPLTDGQRIQVQSAKEQNVRINLPELTNYLNDLSYPLYFLDFETFATAIPVFNGSRPYQQQVFQYSLHKCPHPGGEPVHTAYLAHHDEGDFRLALTGRMLEDCGTHGDILVYNIGFERGKLRDLQTLFPQHSDALQALIDRLKDLMLPFQQRWVYLPEMQGSYSIKKVLPALAPGFSYEELTIGDGAAASAAFAAMLSGHFQGDVAQMRSDLLKYCAMDTQAMIEVLAALERMA